MGPLLHTLFAIACLIAGVVLVCTGHVDQAYIVWAGAGLGAYGIAAQTTGGGASGLDLAGILKMAEKHLAPAPAPGAYTDTGGVRVIPPPEAPAPPPPAAPPLSAP